MTLLRASSRLVLAAVLFLVVASSQLTDGATVASDIETQWQQFVQQFNKKFTNATDAANRKAIWVENLKTVQQQNVAAMHGGHNFTLAINQFADWYPSEYKALLGFRSDNSASGSSRRRRAAASSTYNAPIYKSTVPVSQLPASVNWTAVPGWVNPVQNQGSCGDCWAFSACGALEGQYYNVTKTSMVLSEQNLLDCSQPQGNSGCNGGNMDNAFNYVRLNQGLDSYSSYPYTGKNETCRYSTSNNVVYNTGWTNVQPLSELALQQAVALVGPISVGIDASLPSFQLYHSGVYNPTNCPANLLDHAVLAVGYGTTSAGQAYWLLKNSWGTTWGMQGYMMIARNANNTCGVATNPSFPTGLIKVTPTQPQQQPGQAASGGPATTALASASVLALAALSSLSALFVANENFRTHFTLLH